MHLNRALFQVVAVLAGLSSSALGQGVSGALPADYTITAAVSVPPYDAAWIGRVGSPQAPVLVSLDPFGPAWPKRFTTDTGDPIRSMQKIDIRERLQVQGNYAWTGWHCSLLTEGFEWSTTGDLPALIVRVNDMSVSGLQVTVSDNEIIASFEPLPVGTNVEIRVKMVYNESKPFSGSILMEQYPSPEPTTLCGLLMLIPFVRKR